MELSVATPSSLGMEASWSPTFHTRQTLQRREGASLQRQQDNSQTWQHHLERVDVEVAGRKAKPDGGLSFRQTPNFLGDPECQGGSGGLGNLCSTRVTIPAG